MRRRWRYRHIVAAARQERGTTVDRAFRTTLYALIIVVVGAVVLWWMNQALGGVDFSSRDALGPICAALFAGSLAAVLASLPLAWRDAGLPLREQAKYRAIGQMQSLTAKQQALLALDAVSDWEMGGWNSSLEYVPAARRLTAHEGHAESFLTLRLVEPSEARTVISNRIGATSAEELRAIIGQNLGELSASAQFADALAGDAAPIDRIASLTGHDAATIRALGYGMDTLPATLLRGHDIMRMIQLTRLGFMADYFSETEAWEHLASFGEMVTSYFPTAEAYWSNIGTGIAFLDASEDGLANFDQVRTQLGQSNWPAAELLKSQRLWPLLARDS